jgi:hypothetical protein
MERYFQNLALLEQTINPIMDAVHKKAGLSWRGREEASGLIKERPSSAMGDSGSFQRSDTCTYLDGDLD